MITTREEGVNIIDTICYNIQEKNRLDYTFYNRLSKLERLYNDKKIDFSIVEEKQSEKDLGEQPEKDLKEIKNKIDKNPDKKIVVPNFTGIFYKYNNKEDFYTFFEQISRYANNGMLMISNEGERKEQNIPDIESLGVVDMALSYPTKEGECEVIRKY